MKKTFLNYSYIIFGSISIFILSRVLRNSFFYYSTTNGGIWNVIAIFFMCIYFILILSFVYCKRLPKILVIFNIYLIYIFLNGILHYNFFQLKQLYKLLMSPFFIYVFYTCYYLKSNIYKISKMYTKLFYLLTLINAISFTLYIKGNLSFVMVSNVYYSLCLYPFTLINKKKNIVSTLSIIIVLILSNKRAGVLAFCSGGLMYIIYYNKILKYNVKKTLVIGCFLFMGFNFLQQTEIGANLRLLKRISINQMIKDKGSGRLEIYQKVINSFFNLSLSEKIFGGNYEEIKKNTGHDNVHNDFIEILYTKGIIGAILFTWIYYKLFKYIFQMKEKEYPLTGVYMFIMIINLILSLLSVYFIDFGYSIAGVGCTAHLLSDFKKFLNIKERKKSD